MRLRARGSNVYHVMRPEGPLTWCGDIPGQKWREVEGGSLRECEPCRIAEQRASLQVGDEYHHPARYTGDRKTETHRVAVAGEDPCTVCRAPVGHRLIEPGRSSRLCVECFAAEALVGKRWRVRGKPYVGEVEKVEGGWAWLGGVRVALSLLEEAP